MPGKPPSLDYLEIEPSVRENVNNKETVNLLFVFYDISIML